MKVGICVCQFYHRIPREALDVVSDVCRAVGVGCDEVPDLCELAARDRESLDRLREARVFFGCQKRALRTLFANPPVGIRDIIGDIGESAIPECVDVRRMTAEEIRGVLASKMQDMGNDAGNVNTPISDHSLRTKRDAFDGAIGEEKSDDTQNSQKWIPWFPVIDLERCVGCRKCAEFCMFGVYAARGGEDSEDRGNQTVRVVHPDSCKTNCPACARICPQNAIVFAKSDEAALNGSLEEIVKPTEADQKSFRERLKYRRTPKLFREDD